MFLKRKKPLVVPTTYDDTAILRRIVALEIEQEGLLQRFRKKIKPKAKEEVEEKTESNKYEQFLP